MYLTEDTSRHGRQRRIEDIENAKRAALSDVIGHEVIAVTQIDSAQQVDGARVIPGTVISLPDCAVLHCVGPTGKIKGPLRDPDHQVSITFDL